MAIDRTEPPGARAQAMARLATLQRLRQQFEKTKRSDAIKTVEHLMEAELDWIRKHRDGDEDTRGGA
jgi:hypothetical protein